MQTQAVLRLSAERHSKAFQMGLVIVRQFVCFLRQPRIPQRPPKIKVKNRQHPAFSRVMDQLYASHAALNCALASSRLLALPNGDRPGMLTCTCRSQIPGMRSLA